MFFAWWALATYAHVSRHKWLRVQYDYEWCLRSYSDKNRFGRANEHKWQENRTFACQWSHLTPQQREWTTQLYLAISFVQQRRIPSTRMLCSSQRAFVWSYQTFKCVQIRKINSSNRSHSFCCNCYRTWAGNRRTSCTNRTFSTCHFAIRSKSNVVDISTTFSTAPALPITHACAIAATNTYLTACKWRFYKLNVRFKALTFSKQLIQPIRRHLYSCSSFKNPLRLDS